ncbi:MAG: polysaccharide deacetylase family protein [Gammaproteobacteria bacterium]|nr:polysaccharide deacetylase family protein [Gammaproteobacteria bacterium]MCI0591043.1 polysaccharide deacetylase family protein [Gammaproteobacteria bacterium]
MISAFAIKQFVARAIGFCTNLDKCLIRARQCYVLCYHRVIPANVARTEHVHDAMWIAPETFEAQVCWMQQIGEIVPYERILDPRFKNDWPLFAVTFDDGWKDNYRYALPILQKYKVPAIIFLVTSAIDTGELFWPEDVVTKTQREINAGNRPKVLAALPALCLKEGNFNAEQQPAHQAEAFVEALKWVSDGERKRRIAAYYDRLGVEQKPLPGYVLSWDEVCQMHAAGIAFGSHTHTHRILKYSSPVEIEEELKRSRDIIAARLHVPVQAFAYPNASYKGNEREILARCGYRYGFRIDNLSLRHYTDPYYIPRIISYESIVQNPDYFKLRLLEVPLY